MNGMQRLTESVRIWPQPDEAPDVPPESILRRFLANPDSLDPDLKDQIRASPNCARALEALRRRGTASAEAASHAAFFNTLRTASSPSRPGAPRSSPSPASRVAAVADDVAPYSASACEIRTLGSVWTTRSNVEAWTGQRSAQRYTFKPATVVIVHAEGEMPWDDTLYRVVPLTPAALWPDDWLADDEIRLTLPGVDRFAAHLWLEYPISGCQLDRCLGQLPPEECEKLELGLAAWAEGLPLTPEEGGGLPLDPEHDAEVLLERERLHECASWLPATADARREWWETLTESPTRWLGASIEAPSMSARPFQFARETLSMAAAYGGPTIPMLVRSTPEDGATIQPAGTANELKLNRTPFHAWHSEEAAPIQCRFALQPDSALDESLRPCAGDSVRLVRQAPNGAIVTLAVGAVLSCPCSSEESVAWVLGTRQEIEGLSLGSEHALIVLKEA